MAQSPEGLHAECERVSNGWKASDFVSPLVRASLPIDVSHRNCVCPCFNSKCFFIYRCSHTYVYVTYVNHVDTNVEHKRADAHLAFRANKSPIQEMKQVNFSFSSHYVSCIVFMFVVCDIFKTMFDWIGLHFAVKMRSWHLLIWLWFSMKFYLKIILESLSLAINSRIDDVDWFLGGKST